MIFASFAKILVSFAKILVSFAKILVSLLNRLLIFSKHAIFTNFSMYTGAKTRKHGSGMQIKLRLRQMGVTDRQTTDTQTNITNFETPLHKRPFGQLILHLFSIPVHKKMHDLNSSVVLCNKKLHKLFTKHLFRHIFDKSNADLQISQKMQCLDHPLNAHEIRC